MQWAEVSDGHRARELATVVLHDDQYDIFPNIAQASKSKRRVQQLVVKSRAPPVVLHKEVLMSACPRR